MALRAILITIGDELLNGQVINTNAAWLGRALQDAAVPLAEQRSVPDVPRTMRAVLEEATARYPVVIVSGGLGPTPDDHTRQVLADLAGVELVESPAVMEKLRRLGRRRGWEVTPEHARQAMVPAGVTTLENAIGLAPGFWLPLGDAVICAMPGVPEELRDMTRVELIPRLQALPDREEIGTLTLRTIGVPEAEIVRRLRGVELGPASLAYLPGGGGVDLRLDVRGEGAVESVGAVAARVRERLAAELGPVIYGTGGADLVAVVIDGLRERGWRIALAESCTGGLIAKRLTDVPGSSEVLEGSCVTYSNAAKTELLGVPPDLLREHGAVSVEVATAMAAGARRRLAAEVGLAVTGIAGPGGGTAEKPVGLVLLAIDGPAGSRERTLRLGGSRDQIRRRTANLGIDLLRRYLIDAAPG